MLFAPTEPTGFQWDFNVFISVPHVLHLLALFVPRMFVNSLLFAAWTPLYRMFLHLASLFHQIRINTLIIEYLRIILTTCLQYSFRCSIIHLCMLHKKTIVKL